MKNLRVEGYTLYHYSSLESTNSEALRLAAGGMTDGTIILSDEQTAGRGRYTRKWSSLSGNLCCSLISRVDKTNIPQLAFVVAIAVSDAIKKMVGEGIEVQHKWPNDILIEGKKGAGILLEKTTAIADAVVVGIGVNIKSAPQGYSSVSEYCVVNDNSRIALLKAIVQNYDALKRLWTNDGFIKIRELWLSRAWGLGRDLTVNTFNHQFNGKFISLNFDGDAIFLLDGREVTINCGEIFCI